MGNKTIITKYVITERLKATRNIKHQKYSNSALRNLRYYPNVNEYIFIAMYRVFFSEIAPFQGGRKVHINVKNFKFVFEEIWLSRGNVAALMCEF